MRNIRFYFWYFLMVFTIVFVSTSCKKDESFCITDYQTTINAKSGEVNFKLPNGTTYKGQGALPSVITIGEYSGQWQSIVTKQTPSGVGLEVELVHLFDDGKGNAFWTNDKAVFMPLDNTGARFKLVNIFKIVGGTGGFECAKGQFVNNGNVDFIAGTVTGVMTGNICGGCEK
ncbi:MAG: hypothetical protein ACOVRG_12080 [Saprospiraceae bacterium]